MPIEAVLLDGKPVSIETCPKCGATPFRPFLRGQVQRSLYAGGPLGALLHLLFGWPNARPYCCLVCARCHEIAGYESP